MRGYRGVGGHRSRENDEGRQAPVETARFAGRCADTGAEIQPGDTIQRGPGGRIVLVRACTPRPRPGNPT